MAEKAQKERLETQITADILKFLRSVNGCFAVKVHGGPFGQGGMPDITGCFMGFRFDIEVKRPGKKPTARQQAMMRKIADAGGSVFVAHSVEEVREQMGDDLRRLVYPGLRPELMEGSCEGG